MQPLPLARPASWRLLRHMSRPSTAQLAARGMPPMNSLAWGVRSFGPQPPRLYSSSMPPRPPSPSESETNSAEPKPEPPTEPRLTPEPVTADPSQPFLRDASRPNPPKTPPPSGKEPPRASSRTPSPFDQLSSRVQSSQLLTTTIPRLIDTLQVRLLTASQTLNDLTGYTSIERIKTQNEALETSLAEAHQALRATRQAYKNATGDRAATQRETTTLLARKESWIPQDLERFTELYRRDHTLEQEVARASEALAEAEAEEQRLSQALMAGMLRRYHEEQIWSDRIRRASTWGTWGLMGVNVLLFIVLQLFAEPWRRRRLVKAVVAEEQGVLESVRDELAAVRGLLAGTRPDAAPSPAAGAALDGLLPDAAPAEPPLEADAELAVKEALAAPVVAEAEPETTAQVPLEQREEKLPVTTVTWQEFLSDPAAWRARAEDLYSERRIDLRMRDASVLALQGAAAGAAVASAVALALLRRT